MRLQWLVCRAQRSGRCAGLSVLLGVSGVFRGVLGAHRPCRCAVFGRPAQLRRNAAAAACPDRTDRVSRGRFIPGVAGRQDTGGYLSAAENTASLFLNSGKIIYSLETSNNTIVYKDETKEKREYEIVVLINNGSASAAEILAIALKESYGATLVGNKTYGKGKVQQIIGDSAKYTFAKWLTPNGNCIDGVGIAPDYNISNFVGELTDQQLNKAIELLSN